MILTAVVKKIRQKKTQHFYYFLLGFNFFHSRNAIFIFIGLLSCYFYYFIIVMALCYSFYSTDQTLRKA